MNISGSQLFSSNGTGRSFIASSSSFPIRKKSIWEKCSTREKPARDSITSFCERREREARPKKRKKKICITTVTEYITPGQDRKNEIRQDGWKEGDLDLEEIDFFLRDIFFLLSPRIEWFRYDQSCMEYIISTVMSVENSSEDALFILGTSAGSWLFRLWIIIPDHDDISIPRWREREGEGEMKMIPFYDVKDTHIVKDSALFEGNTILCYTWETKGNFSPTLP